MKRKKLMVIKNSCASEPDLKVVLPLAGSTSYTTFLTLTGVPSQELCRRIGIPSACDTNLRNDASHTAFETSATRAHIVVSELDKVPLACDNDFTKAAIAMIGQATVFKRNVTQ